jgi:beta-N-acetylhexosaminidase
VDAALLAGRRLWIGIPGTGIDDETRRLLEDVRPGGVILFRRNVESREQVARLVASLRSVLGDALHVAVDQEGGLVVRFEHELTTFPGNMALGAAAMREPSLGEHLAEAQGRIAAAELRTLGVTVNLAPCCDLATRGDNPGLGTRSFAVHARLAGRLAAAMVRGHAGMEVVSTLKHFPGLGNAGVDSHLDLPVAQAGDLDLLLEPFLAGILAGAPLVMTTHVQFRDVDDAPATFSKRIVGGLLRERVGHRGCVITDDLEMGAMTARFGFDDVVRRSSAAGHDILAICHDAARQRRARDLLAAACERGEGWSGDPEAILARLDALRTPRAAVAPPPEPGDEVADAIAGRAVTVVRDDGRLLPLRAGEPVLVVTVGGRTQTQVEDPLRGEALGVLRAGFPPPSSFCEMPPAAIASGLPAIVGEAARFGRVLVLTTLARFRPDEARLVRELLPHPGCVVIALRNPFDFEVVPEGARATLVTAYGFRPVHQRALLKVLRGDVEAYGRLPIRLDSV